MFFLGLIVILLGLLMVISPHGVYYIAESWKSKRDAEPSAAYKIMIRIGGVLCICAGIGLCIVSFFV